MYLDSTQDQVAGRIHRSQFRDFWLSKVKVNNEIADLLEDGYVPPFTQWLPQSDQPDNNSALGLEARDLLREEIKALEASGSISKVKVKPWCILPMQLVKREGKATRLVIDCSRQINPYIKVRKVRLS